MNRDDVKISAPCMLDWKKMTSADGGRFCGDCKKVVKDLSSMTEREARALLKGARGGDLCVRFVYDAQGRVFFGKDAPKKDLVPATFLLRARRVAAAAAIGAMPFATQACDLVAAPLGITEDETHPPKGELMGGVALDDRPPPPYADDGSADAATTDASADASPSEDASPAEDAGADGGEIIPIY